MKLKELQCVPCKAGDPALNKDEIEALKPQIPEWQVFEREGIPHLERIYKFKDFQQALDFTNRVGGLAEEQDHHPQLVTEWGKVTVQWWTHVVKGLHKNDFIMAAKTDDLL